MTTEIEPLPVGYKQPPTSTQFQPGTSGNPCGTACAESDHNEVESLERVARPPRLGQSLHTLISRLILNTRTLKQGKRWLMVI